MSMIIPGMITGRMITGGPRADMPSTSTSVTIGTKGSEGAGERRMDEQRARALLEAERAEVLDLLKGTEEAGQQDRESELETGDIADAAQPLEAEGMDDAIEESLRDRLGALDRALARLDSGTYGTSVRSGVPIPDERLEADPAAELTVEEAAER